MSTVFWLRQTLEQNPNVKSIDDQMDKILVLTVETQSGDVQYKVYRAPKEEYVLGIENVEEAISLEANVIVYDQWGEITIPARRMAKSKGIAVQSFGQFTHSITEGKCLV